jgi:hypothetical protein
MEESRLWLLISLKLSGEASEQDLAELNKILAEHPCVTHQLDMLISLWENKRVPQDKGNATAFEKLAEKIKQMNYTETKPLEETDRG